MKQILIALLLVFTTHTVVNAQNPTTTVSDTAIGVDATSIDPTQADSTHYSSASIGIDTDDDDFPFGNFEKAVGGGILVAIVSIVAVFGLPVFVLAIVFFFRYKNRKARYRLAEQALAAGQPLPTDFIRENQPTDQRSQGIKNTFTGIGLFIFLWAITGELGIGCIGLMIMFMGIGQWIVGYQQKMPANKVSEIKVEEPIGISTPQSTTEKMRQSTTESTLEKTPESTLESTLEKTEENK